MCCCEPKMKKMSSRKHPPVNMDQQVSKEGFMEKKTGIIKSWKNRFFVLLDDVLVYFLKEEQKDSLTPTGRIFFSDIASIERSENKSRPFCIVITTDTKKHLMSCASYLEREDWINKIWEGKETHKKQEAGDPVRRRSTRLGKEYKRVTIKKDPTHGIGCTIKNVGGAIFVSRIIPDGPVATSGVLRPGDQIIDINGTRVSHSAIELIKEIIRSSPEYVVCTVKPVTHYTSHDDSPTLTRTAYTEVDPAMLREQETSYAQVEVGTYSEFGSDLDLTDSVSERNRQSSDFPNYMNDAASQKSKDNFRVSKKPTVQNYAELEFGSRR